MPLTARTVDSDMVIASDLYDNDRAQNYYKCRFCGEDMVLVLPKKEIVKHFRHVVKSDCPNSGESMIHLEAKKYFYDLYKHDNTYTNASMEEIVGDRIGDVVLYTPNDVPNIVIEVQNSSIPIEEIWDRFDDWNAAGYSMIWVVTQNVINPEAEYSEARIPKWARALHTMFFGRVYVYSDDNIFSAHLFPVYRDNEWTSGSRYCITIKDVEVRKLNSSDMHNINNKHRCLTLFNDGIWWKMYKTVGIGSYRRWVDGE